MKVVLSQVNVGSKFRFMPSGVSSSLSNYPRDGWLTEAAARKWANANGHEIVKVEKVAGNGEKIHRIEYTYKDRFGKTKKQTSELVGKDVEPLKKRIVEGLTRNGDKLVSFGRITSKDSAEDSLVQRIVDKYAINDGFLQADKDWRRKVISYIKTKWRLPDSYLNRFIRDFDRDLGDIFKQNESWEKVTRWIDGRVKKIDVNPYSNSYKHSLIASRKKEPGKKGSALKKDSADEADEAFGIKIPDNEKGTERATMDKVFKELYLANAWKKVKKGNTIVIRTNINGKDQDVAIIQYFNPNTVSITPRKGAPSMVSLKNASVMAAKMGVEGRRSYNDSADDFASDAMDRIRAKYCLDKSSEILVYKIFDKNSNIVAQGVLGNVNTIPWNDLRQKASNGGKPWKTISVFRKGEKRAIDYITNKDSK